jgi:PAS domain S-box-containing protein
MATGGSRLATRRAEIPEAVAVKLQTKLSLALVIVGLGGSLATGWLGYRSEESALERAAFERLTSVRASKTREIQAYFRQLRAQIITLSEDHMVVDAMRELAAGFDAMGALSDDLPSRKRDLATYYAEEFVPRLTAAHEASVIDTPAYLPDSAAGVRLQSLYIAANPYREGEKVLLDDAGDGGAYSRSHRRYHPTLRDYIQQFGLDDLLLINPDGDVVYSVFKECVDFATNLRRGPYRDTGIAAVYRAALTAPPKTAILHDFERYIPSYGDPTAFIAAPIFDGDTRIGVVAFQIPITGINARVTGNDSWRDEGLGETGETYLVASDYTLRNDCRRLIEARETYLSLLAAKGMDDATLEEIRAHHTSILFQRERNEAVRAGLAGRTGIANIRDFREGPALCAYGPLEIPGVSWAIVAKMDTAEVFAPLTELRRHALGVGAVVAGLILLVSAWIARRLTKPLQQMLLGTHEVELGNLDHRIPTLSRDDLGALTLSFNQMAASLAETTVRRENLERMVEQRTQELAERVAEKSALLSAMPAYVYFKDRDLNYGIVNQSFADMVGLPSDEVRGKSDYDLFPPAAAEVYRRADRQVIERGVPLVDLEETYNTPDGVRHWATTTKVPVRGEDGEIIGMVGTSLDVTARRKAEEELRRSEARFRELTTLAPIGIQLMDPVGKCRFVNERWCEWTGFEPEEALGHGWVAALDSEDRYAVFASWGQLVEGSGRRGLEYRLRDRAGKATWVHGLATPIADETGDTAGFIGVTVDITENRRARRQIEAQRRRLEELVDELRKAQQALVQKERLAAVGQLAAIISHELRNPLGTISTSVHTLRRRLSDKGLAVDEPIDRIGRSVARCDAIIGELLDYTRTTVLHTEPVVVDEWLHELLGTHSLPGGITLREEYGGEVAVMIDRERMRRAIINVLENAVQATVASDPPVPISVTTRAVDGRVGIAIEDVGPGISEEVMGRLFEPFFSTKGFGTGLGLAIVKQIVEQHGGGIEVTSTLGSGTRVTLWLPLATTVHEGAT